MKYNIGGGGGDFASKFSHIILLAFTPGCPRRAAAADQRLLFGIGHLSLRPMLREWSEMSRNLRLECLRFGPEH